MRPEDVYELRWAADPRIAPDGETVAFVAEEANDLALVLRTPDVTELLDEREVERLLGLRLRFVIGIRG